MSSYNSAMDYGEISVELKDQGLGRVRQAKRTRQEYITRLSEFGLLALGTRQMRSAPGYNPPVHFRVAIVTVLRADNPGIVPAAEAARPAAKRGHAALAGEAGP